MKQIVHLVQSRLHAAILVTLLLIAADLEAQRAKVGGGSSGRASVKSSSSSGRASVGSSSSSSSSRSSSSSSSSRRSSSSSSYSSPSSSSSSSSSSSYSSGSSSSSSSPSYSSGSGSYGGSGSSSSSSSSYDDDSDDDDYSSGSGSSSSSYRSSSSGTSKSYNSSNWGTVQSTKKRDAQTKRLAEEARQRAAEKREQQRLEVIKRIKVARAEKVRKEKAAKDNRDKEAQATVKAFETTAGSKSLTTDQRKQVAQMRSQMHAGHAKAKPGLQKIQGTPATVVGTGTGQTVGLTATTDDDEVKDDVGKTKVKGSRTVAIRPNVLEQFQVTPPNPDPNPNPDPGAGSGGINNNVFVNFYYDWYVDNTSYYWGGGGGGYCYYFGSGYYPQLPSYVWLIEFGFARLERMSEYPLWESETFVRRYEGELYLVLGYINQLRNNWDVSGYDMLWQYYYELLERYGQGGVYNWNEQGYMLSSDYLNYFAAKADLIPWIMPELELYDAEDSLWVDTTFASPEGGRKYLEHVRYFNPNEIRIAIQDAYDFDATIADADITKAVKTVMIQYKYSSFVKLLNWKISKDLQAAKDLKSTDADKAYALAQNALNLNDAILTMDDIKFYMDQHETISELLTEIKPSQDVDADSDE